MSKKNIKVLDRLLLGALKRYYDNKRRRLRTKIGIVDICQGFGGVLVEPSFFPETVFDIPELLWMVDDVWLSGQLTINSIQIRQVSNYNEKLRKNLKAHRTASLKKYVYNNYSRVDADMMYVALFPQ